MTKKKEEIPIYIMRDSLKNILNFIKDNREILTLIAILFTALITLYSVLSQKQQFHITNRAKINYKEIEGSIDGGVILVENMGDLPARNFRLIWKVVKIDVGEEEGEDKRKLREKKEHEGGEKQDKVGVDEIIEIPYTSGFVNTDEVIVIIAAWKYQCRDIENYVMKDCVFQWNIHLKPNPLWSLIYSMGHPHIDKIISKKTELRQFLEKEN